MPKPLKRACSAKHYATGFRTSNCSVDTGRALPCGEETALINSLEGRRADRCPTPFPAISGVWGKPTCVNNVETLCNVPAILGNGVEWYLTIPKSKELAPSHGLLRRSTNPALSGTAVDITAREFLEDYAAACGWPPPNLALQPRGAGPDFLTEAPRFARWTLTASAGWAAEWVRGWRWRWT
ncbi:hypothetical protein ACNKHU_13995 [Shigella flexneri]